MEPLDRKTPSFDRMIEDLGAGDHVGLWYGSEEERVRDVLPLLRRALDQGSHCLWMSSDDGWNAVASALEEEGVDVAAARSEGRLTVRTDREPFVTDDDVEADLLLEAFREELAATPEEGLPVWVFNDMAWALGRGEADDEIRKALESWVRRHLADHRAVVVCQYRRPALSDETMEAFLREHPFVLMNGVLFPNPFQVPPEEELADGGMTRIEWMLEGLESRATEVVRIRRSERALETLLDNIPDVVVRMDRKGRFLFVNDRAARLAGLSAEEMIGKSHEELGIEREPRRPWLEAMERVAAEGRAEELEERFEVAGSEARWFQSRVIPETGPDGEVESVLVIGRDVTERRQAQAAVEGTVTLLRQVFASLEEAVFVIRPPERRVIMCNQAAADMLGYEREELLGRSTQHFHVDDASWERFGRESQAVLRTGAVFHASFALRRRDGSVFPTEHTVTLLDPEEGLEGGVVSVVRDVSEARRVEELLNSLGVAVFRCRPDGTILHVNDAAGAVLRLGPGEELAGAAAQDVLADEGSWERIVDAVRASASGRATVQVRIRRRDGSHGWVSGVGRFLRLPDGEAVVEGVVQDVTEEMRLREEVVEVSAEERLRIGQNLHDDLGQHLTGLALLARNLARRLAREERPETRDAAEIERLANQAVGKTRHLARGLHPPLLEQQGLAGALEQLVGEAEELFGLSAVLEVEGEPRAVSTAEAEHLYRIAQEATTNAARHGGADELRVTWAAKPGARLLVVQDDGAGFRPKEVDQGLGLRIMRYRARLLGGELEILSAPGTGTTVRCALPPVDANGTAAEAIRGAR